MSPKATIKESYIKTFDDIAINSGIYEFALEDGSIKQARYSFVYQKISNEWYIIEHHSSQQPE